MRRVLLTALAVVSLSGATFAGTVVVPIAFRDVVSEATLIIRGHVTDVRAIATPDSGVDSVATVAVDALLKGTSPAFVSVHVPGGVQGRYRFVMVGAPTLRTNQHAVFFLKRGRDNAWRPVGLSAGVVRVERAAASGAAVVRPPVLLGSTASVGRVVRGDSRRGPWPVEEFESLVRTVIASQALAVAGRAE